MSKFRNNKSFSDKLNINLLTPIILAIIILTSFQLSTPAPAFATTVVEFTLRTPQHVYVPGETLEVFGTAEPNEILAVRLFDPAGLAIRIENLEVDGEGSFRKEIFTWPEASRNLPFGTYTIEAIASIRDTEPKKVEITFTGGFDQGIDPSRGHILAVKLDAPSQVTVNSVFRIFVQITFDGALVEAVDDKAVLAILGTSHIHSSDSTINLSEKFKELHPGLYYADVLLATEDAYVIHAAAFYRGFLSHDTRLVAVSASSFGTIQESVDRLSTELDTLQEGLGETRFALNDTKTTITNSVEDARASIREEIELAQQASGQINSLILPVLALISVIIALQISLFARIRASYR